MCSCAPFSEWAITLGQQAETHKARQQEKKRHSIMGRKSINLDTEVRSDKTQISSGASKTTVTLERFRPHVSLRTSTTSESTCNIKFLIICFRMSECTLQGYNGVASALYVVLPWACNRLKHMKLSRSGSRRTTNRGSLCVT